MAFVFPLLFMLVYGAITYSYMFLLTTAVHYAAQVGAESAVAVAPDSDEDAYHEKVADTVADSVLLSLSWVQASQLERLTIVAPSFDTDSAGNPIVTVELLFDTGGLFAVIDLPFVGAIPKFPETVRATAIAAI